MTKNARLKCGLRKFILSILTVYSVLEKRKCLEDACQLD